MELFYDIKYPIGEDPGYPGETPGGRFSLSIPGEPQMYAPPPRYKRLPQARLVKPLPVGANGSSGRHDALAGERD
jgi:hypothetical protein